MKEKEGKIRLIWDVLMTYFLTNNTVDLLLKRKKTKLKIYFDDDQVSDLTRRCEKEAHIYVYIYINECRFFTYDINIHYSKWEILSFERRIFLDKRRGKK